MIVYVRILLSLNVILLPNLGQVQAASCVEVAVTNLFFDFP
jgi:hypothetical protein